MRTCRWGWGSSWRCSRLVLLEVVDGGEAVDQEGKIARHCELDKEDLDCSRCHQGSGWLATPQGCRLLAQVLSQLLQLFPRKPNDKFS